MHVIPTPAKGGKYLNYLCTEFCRFLIWIGQTTVALKCDQEPSTLSVLEAVKKTCRALGIRTLTETVPAGSHASNGAAEVTVKVIRQYANLLMVALDKPLDAVMNLPPTPVEVEDGPHPSRLPAVAAPPVLGVAAPAIGSTSGVHGREPTDEAAEASRPVKYPRIMAVFEHEDDTHALHFEDAEVDNLEMYEYDCDEKDDGGASPELAPSDVLKRLCVPYSTFEPELEPAKLLELDLLADELEISAFVCSILHF
eukprot:s4209_g3.t1